jgi:hypothetical protein
MDQYKSQHHQKKKKVDFLLRLLTFLAISVQKKNICSNPEKEDCHLGL